MSSRTFVVSTYVFNELKRAATQRFQASSKSMSSSAPQIKKDKRTRKLIGQDANQTFQAHSQSSRSSTQQIKKVERTERSSAQQMNQVTHQMKQVQRTANLSGQAHSNLQSSSAQQMEEVKRTVNQRGHIHSTFKRSIERHWLVWLRVHVHMDQAASPSLSCFAQWNLD